MLKRLIAATTQPVSLERAKDRLHISGSDFDDDLTALIVAATAALEDHASLILQPSTWEYRLGGWHWQCFRERFDGQLLNPWPALQIPAAPVRDVTELNYFNEAGTETPIDPSLYSWERTREGADLLLARDFTLPILAAQLYPIRVVFSAGYDNPQSSGSGDDPDLILPPQAEMAILFLVGHWFANRENVNVGNITSELPNTFEYLVRQLRVYR